MIAPRFVFDFEPLLTGTAVVGVTTDVEVLKTTVTDPPGRVDDEEITEREVVGGKVDMVDEVVEEGGVTLPPSEQDEPKSVAVAEVNVLIVCDNGLGSGQ